MLKPIRIDASSPDGRTRLVDTIVIDPNCLPVSSSSLSFYRQNEYNPSLFRNNNDDHFLQAIAHEMAYDLLCDMEVQGAATRTAKHFVGRISLLESGHYFRYEEEHKQAPIGSGPNQMIGCKIDSLLSRVTKQIYNQLQWMLRQLPQDESNRIVSKRVAFQKYHDDKVKQQEQEPQTQSNKRKLSDSDKEMKDEPNSNKKQKLDPPQPDEEPQKESLNDPADSKELQISSRSSNESKPPQPTNLSSSAATKASSSTTTITTSPPTTSMTMKDGKGIKHANLQQIHIHLRENDIVIKDSFYVDLNNINMEGGSPVDIANQMVRDLKLPIHCAVAITASIVEQLNGIAMNTSTSQLKKPPPVSTVPNKLGITTSSPMPIQNYKKNNLNALPINVSGAWRLGPKEKMTMDAVVITNNYIQKK